MSTGHIPVSLQRRVRLRANERCEYCRISQVGQEATFHVDHVMPQAAGGVTSLENLALACVSCSLRKGARTTAIDPATGDAAQLFHPSHMNGSEVVVDGGWFARGLESGLRIMGPAPIDEALDLRTLDRTCKAFAEPPGTEHAEPIQLPAAG
jgi:hypothetical protein